MRKPQGAVPRGAGWSVVESSPRGFRKLLGDVDADVCVVGGSVAGFTAATRLAGRGYVVALVESGPIGASIPDAGLGLVTAGFPETLDAIIARAGVARARALWALSAEGVAEVRAVLADGQGAAVPAGQLTLWQDAGAETVEIASRRAAQLRYFGADAQARTAAQVSAALRGVAGAPGVHRADAFSVNPHDYMRLLVARAEEAGVRIFENAGLAMMDVNGVRKHVIGQAGQVRAAHIVLAAGGENAELHPQLARSVGTLWRPVAATAPLDRLAAEVVAFEGLVSFAGRDAERFRRDGERLIHAGALQAAGRLPPAFALRVARRIGRLFPALRGLTVATTWLAQERLTAHRMPQVAEIAPSLWVADAFGDAGIGNATMAGELIARGISEGDDRWRLFDVYGLGRAGLATHRGVAAATLGLGRAARVLRALAKRVVSADAAEQYPLPAPSVPALQHAPQPVALIAAPVQAIATPAVVDPATAESETLPEPVPAVAAATPAKPVRKRAPRSKKPAVEAIGEAMKAPVEKRKLRKAAQRVRREEPVERGGFVGPAAPNGRGQAVHSPGKD